MSNGVSASAESLKLVRESLIANLSTHISDCNMPSYEVDGTRFEWNEWLEAQRKLLKELQLLEASQPYELQTVYLDPALGI